MKKLKKALVVMLAVLCLLLSGCSFGREVRRAEEKIASIGIVTAESGPVIEEAEAAMDALSQKEREKVSGSDRSGSRRCGVLLSENGSLPRM